MGPLIIAVLLNTGQVRAADNTMSAAEEGNRAIPGDYLYCPLAQLVERATVNQTAKFDKVKL